MAKEKKSGNLKYWVETLKVYDLKLQGKGTVGDIIDDLFDQFEHGDQRVFGLYIKLVQMPEKMTIKEAVRLILRDVIMYAQDQQNQQKKQ